MDPDPLGARMAVAQATADTAGIVVDGDSGSNPSIYLRSASGNSALFRYPTSGMAVRDSADIQTIQLTSTQDVVVGPAATLSTSPPGRLSVGYPGGGSKYGIVLRPVADSTNAIHFNNAAGSTVGACVTTAAATSYLTSSDVRLKKNIAPAPDASYVMDQIRVVSHDWKAADGHVTWGIIAQELDLVAPEVVRRGDEDQTWMVDYSKLVPMLVNEVQSLRRRVRQLES